MLHLIRASAGEFYCENCSLAHICETAWGAPTDRVILHAELEEVFGDGPNKFWKGECPQG